MTRLACLTVVGVLVASPLWALVRYVDTVAGTCSGTSYSIAMQNCMGSDGPSYATAAEAETATTAASGDIIYFRDGTHEDGDDSLTLLRTGTSCGVPILWSNYTGEAPVLTFTISINGVDNRRFAGESITITRADPAHPTIGGNPFILDGTDVAGTNRRGFYQNGGTAVCIDLDNMVVRDWGYAGFYGNNCQTCTISYSHVENTGMADNVVDHGDAIHFTGTSTGSSVDHSVIDDCEDDCTTTNGQTWSDNYIADCNKPSELVSGAHPDCAEGTNGSYYRNFIKNARNAHIIQAQDSISIIVGNVFDQDSDWAYGNDQLQMSGVASALIIGNTSVRATSSFIRLLNSPISPNNPARNVTVINNVVYGPTDVPIDIGVDNATGFGSDYNGYGDLPGTDIINLEGNGLTLGEAQALTIETHSPAVADPMFTDFAKGDYSLQTGSPLANIGLTLGAPYNEDIDGVARPQGVGFEIGAYEIPDVPESPAPDAFRRLRIF